MARRIWWILAVGGWTLGLVVGAGGCTFDETVGTRACDGCDRGASDGVSTAEDTGTRRGDDVRRTDARRPRDTAADTAPPAETCDYKGRSVGVCDDVRILRGDCPKPSEYELEETSCDGLDNDCDGKVDEMARDCYPASAEGTPGTGICEHGRQSCESGSWTECRAAVTAKSEAPSRCDDGRDNDCDGQTDLEDSECRHRKRAGSTCNRNVECRSRRCLPFGGRNTPNRCAHLAFVTSEKWTGDLGGLAGADRKCRQLAQAVGLAGKWKAVLSRAHPHEAARDRLRIVAPVVNMKAKVVASTRKQLWRGHKDLTHPVVFDERRQKQQGEVWTGSSGGGHFSDSCGENWKDDGEHEHARLGRSGEIDRDWLSDDTEECEDKRRLYCIDGQ